MCMEIKRTWIVKTTLRNNKAGGIILPDFKPYYKTVVSESKHYSTSLVAQRVKHLLAMRETWVWSLGREDPLENEMATHSSTLAWKIPWTEKPGRLQSMGSQRAGHDRVTSPHSTGEKKKKRRHIDQCNRI